MESLNGADLERLPPIERQHFADQCRRLLPLAEPKADGPDAGVLADLQRGVRSETAAP